MASLARSTLFLLAAMTLATVSVRTTAAAPPKSVSKPAGKAGKPAKNDPRAAQKKRAIELFQQSEEMYRQGRFKECADLLKEAYALDPDPTLLFNLARALESHGDLAAAIDAYTRYLGAEPEATDRLAIEKRLETLKTQEKQRQELEARAKASSVAPPAPAPAPPPEQQLTAQSPPPEKSGAMRLLPWITAGAGVAAIAAGGVFGLTAKSRHDSAVLEATNATASELVDERDSFATMANVSFVAGGILAAGGLAWAFLAPGGPSAADTKTDPDPEEEKKLEEEKAEEPALRVSPNEDF